MTNEEKKVMENTEVKKEEVVSKTSEVSATKEVAAPVKKDSDKDNKRPWSRNNGKNNPRRRNNQRERNGRPVSEFEEKVIDIARVTTVVKGGRRFSFSALVVVGNKKGKVGWGHGKAKEVPDAIKKAIKDARNHMINTPIIDKRTVPHDQIGKFLASEVLVKPAPKGKGVIASGAIRSVVELAGYKDIYTKSLGSRSKTNSVKATIKALEALRTVEQIASLRDKEVKDIIG